MLPRFILKLRKKVHEAICALDVWLSTHNTIPIIEILLIVDEIVELHKFTEIIEEKRRRENENNKTEKTFKTETGKRKQTI